jgi:short-subunit dehydrogenase
MLDALAAELATGRPDLGVVTVVADLAVAGEREVLASRLMDEGLVPDLLVNNAGMGDYGEFVDAEWPKVEAMIRINVEALTAMAHGFVPGMIATGGGSVINVSSLASLIPIPDFAVYAATKAYVTSFSEALRLELSDYHVHVSALCPGPVHTEFGAVARRGRAGRESPLREWSYVDPATVVREALDGVARNRPRVFPGLKIAALAAVLGLLPVAVIRLAMSTRPRRA